MNGNFPTALSHILWQQYKEIAQAILFQRRCWGTKESSMELVCKPSIHFAAPVSKWSIFNKQSASCGLNATPHIQRDTFQRARSRRSTKRDGDFLCSFLFLSASKNCEEKTLLAESQEREDAGRIAKKKRYCLSQGLICSCCASASLFCK